MAFKATTVPVSEETARLISEMRSEVDSWETGGAFTFWEFMARIVDSARRDVREGREKEFSDLMFFDDVEV